MTLADRPTSQRRIGLADVSREAGRPGGLGLRVALALSVALHAGLGVYLWKTRFEPRYQTYAEETVTDVALIKPVPPPPPPPPKVEEPPKPRTPPPVQPRPPKQVAVITEVPPLPIPPVERRVEVPKLPPVAVAPPPAPPAPPAPAPAPPVITRPDWLRRPSAEDFARYYPERAQRRGIEGRATIGCVVSAQGALEDCRVAAETPPDSGFGAAAVRMSREFRMRPMTRDGEPVAGGIVRIPIRFDLPD